MTRKIDIRDKKSMSGQEIQALNFINDTGRYCFRKYYRSGLRSHIFEVLLALEVDNEVNGILEDGIKIFPRACPKKIFRIFRHRFKSLEQIFDEIQKYNILLNALGADLIAISEEFIVDYTINGESQILLCGLQEYIDGVILDPWKIFDHDYLPQVYATLPGSSISCEQFVKTAMKLVGVFTKNIRKMIIKNQYIPDLAGIGNLILTPEGNLKLVDINNIVTINFEPQIPLDDKNYPSCDVSIHVLYILEKKLLRKDLNPKDPLYNFFLSEPRMKKVKKLEQEFYASL